MGRWLVACLIGIVAFMVVLAGTGLAIGGISKVTKSGLLGICGPYGSNTAIYVMLGVLAAGPLCGFWVGVVAARRFLRSRNGNRGQEASGGT